MPKRKSSWAMLIWTVLILVWIVAGVGSLGPTSNDAQAAGQAVGATLGVGFILFVWFIDRSRGRNDANGWSSWRRRSRIRTG